MTSSASAARAMFHTILARWRSTETMLRQSEKLAQLGTFTAGIAHELNNPAAAVVRAADQLRNALGGGAETLQLDPVERSDREEEIEEVLDDLGVDRPWDVAATLVDRGWDEARVRAIAAGLPANELSSTLHALAAVWSGEQLIDEIAQGAGRISEIVKALKSYSYLDQAPAQPVDVHLGIDSTLVIMRHKLASGIRLAKSFADELPLVDGYGGELNQVWTNLIDNAADAMEGEGVLSIRTRRIGEWIEVEIEDDGPGVDPAVRDRLFEPFVTTKAPGKGTGLGLDISYRIVVHRHRGELKVFSEPGRTVFQVRLPIDPTGKRTQTGTPPVEPVGRLYDDVLKTLLSSLKTLAVVGASVRPEAPGHTVPAYLQGQGLRIIPVNPGAEEIFGELAYKDLASIPADAEIDAVLVFRRSEFVPDIVAAAIQRGSPRSCGRTASSTRRQPCAPAAPASLWCKTTA